MCPFHMQIDFMLDRLLKQIIPSPNALSLCAEVLFTLLKQLFNLVSVISGYAVQTPQLKLGITRRI